RGNYNADSRASSMTRSDIKCHRCGKIGHIKRNCRVPEHALDKSQLPPNHHHRNTAEQRPQSRYNDARFGRKQHNPHEAGSVAVASSIHTGAELVSLTRAADISKYLDGNIHFSSVAAQTLSNSVGKLQLWDAILNGQSASLLRDSGCTTVGVHRSFVKPEDYTGRNISCITFRGTVEKFPTAIIFLQSEFYSGSLEAAVLPNPVADIILGNINGAKATEMVMKTACQLQDHCKSLADDWGEVQKEKDKVVDKYSKTTQQLRNEDSNLPNNLEEMHLRLLKYCEKIILAKVAKEHAEDTVRAQVAFLKAQVTGDQKEPVSLEEAPT
ncbi:rab GTPase-binding effector protein 1-like, partial [Elysia marginata]